MIGFKRCLLVLFFGVVLPTRLFAAEGPLLELYRLAQLNDPTFLAARSSLAAEREYKAIGLAQLLPSLSGSLDWSKVETERQPWPVAPASEFKYSSNGRTLRLNMPLLDLGRIAAFREGLAKGEMAEIRFALAGQDLLLRLSESYFNYLLAIDNLELAVAQREAYTSRKIQAENLFKAGIATVTDIEESTAREMVARADELSARSVQEIHRKELERIIGGELPPGLAPIADSSLIRLPEPADLPPWVAIASERNLSLIEARFQQTIAGFQLSQQRSTMYPSASLVGNYSSNERPAFNTAQQDSYVLGVQVNMQLFSGGRDAALTRQAAANAEKARYLVDAARKEAELRTTRAFLDVVSGVSRVEAYTQAVKSAEVAIRGMEAGQRAGLRTNTDVLNAQQMYYTSRRDLQRERYAYLLNRLRLKAFIGELSIDDIRGL